MAIASKFGGSELLSLVRERQAAIVGKINRFSMFRSTMMAGAGAIVLGAAGIVASTPTNAAPSMLNVATCPGAEVSFPLETGSIQWLYRDPDAIPVDGHIHTGIDVWGPSWQSAGGSPVGAPFAGTFERKSGSGVHIVNDARTIDVYMSHVKFEGWVANGVHVERGEKLGTVDGGWVHLSLSRLIGFNDLDPSQVVDPSPYLRADLNVDAGARKSSKPLIDWCNTSEPPSAGAGFRAHWVEAPGDGGLVLSGPVRLTAEIDVMPKPIQRVEFTYYTAEMGAWSGPWGIACVASSPSLLNNRRFSCEFYPPFSIDFGAEVQLSFDVYATDGTRTLSPGWLKGFLWAGLGFPGDGGGSAPSPRVLARIEDGPGSTDRIEIALGEELADLGFMNDRASIVTVPSGDGVGELVCFTEKGFVGTPYRYGSGRTYTLGGFEDNVLSSCRFERAGTPRPTVAIVTRPAECVAPGSLAFAWSGTNATQYSYRFDGSEWTETSSTAAAVSASGTRSHTFELKALGHGGESDIVSYAFQSDDTPPTVHPIKLTGSRDANQIFRSDLDSEISVTDEGCGGVATADVRGLEFDWQPVSEQLVLRGSGPRALFVRAVDGVGNAVLVKTEPFLMSQAIISQVEGPLSVSGRTTLTGPIDVPSIKVCKTTSTTITGPVYVQDPTKTELCSNTGLSLGPIIASAEPFPLIRYDPELLCALADVVYNGNKSLAPTGTTYDNKIICVRGTLTWYGTNIRGNVLVVVVGGDFRYYGTGDVISSADAAADRTGLVVFTTGMAKFSGCTGASISGHIIALNGISGLGTNCHFSGSLHSDRGTAISGTGSTLRYDPVIASSTYEIPIAAITDDELRELLEGNAAGEASPTPAGTPTATPSPTPTSTPTPSPTASPTPTTFTPSPTPTPSATSATVVSGGGFELRIDAASMTVRSGRTADFTGRLSTASGISCLASVTVQGLPSTFTVFQDLAGLSSSDWETFSILLWPSSSTSLGTFPANVVAKCGATELRLAITVTVVP